MAELRAPVITFSDIDSILRVTGTLAHGITPSAIRIDFAKQIIPLRRSGDLTIEFEGRRVVWRDCLIDATTATDAQSGRIDSITVFDRRWQWALQTVSFSFNEQNDAGEIRVKPTAQDLQNEGRTDREIKIIQQFYDTQRSAQAIGAFLLEAMGERDIVANDLPDDVFPEFALDNVPPAAALARLCDWFACTIALRKDNKVGVHKLGIGKELPRQGALPILFESRAVDLNVRPEKVVVITNPVLYQWDMRLEPVGEDTDGNFRPVDELSYKPAGGWTLASILKAPLQLDIDSAKQKQIRRLINRSLYRCFRPFYRGGNSAGIDEIMRIDGILVVMYDQIAPFQNRLIPTVFKQGARRPQEPFVYGQFLNLSPLGLNVEDADFDVPSVETPQDSASIVDVGFSIDTKNGVVWFSQPLFRQDANNALADPDIFLRAAFHLKDTATRVRKRFQLDLDITPPVVAGLEQYQVVEALQPTVRFDFEKERPSAGADGAIIVRRRVDNSGELFRKARPYLEAMKRRIEDDHGPEDVTYAGLVDSIELDGAIRSITWNASASGVTTRVQRNQDRGSATTLSFTELRNIERQAEGTKINDRVPSERLRRVAMDRQGQQQ